MDLPIIRCPFTTLGLTQFVDLCAAGCMQAPGIPVQIEGLGLTSTQVSTYTADVPTILTPGSNAAPRVHPIVARARQIAPSAAPRPDPASARRVEVLSEEIGLSTPYDPKILEAHLGVCTVVQGTREAQGGGTENVLVHLSPAAHVTPFFESHERGLADCIYRQYIRFAEENLSQMDSLASVRRFYYLKFMLEILRHGNWRAKMFSARPEFKDNDMATDLKNAVKRYLSGELHYDESELEDNLVDVVEVVPG